MIIRMIIISLLIGVFCGCSVSLFIISSEVADSNDYGNYTAGFRHFCDDGLNVIDEKDKIKRPL